MQIRGINIEAWANFVHARIAGRAEDFIHDLRLSDFPSQGVFAATRSDDKYFHGAS